MREGIRNFLWNAAFWTVALGIATAVWSLTGCADEDPLEPVLDDVEAVVVAIPPLPEDCLCICGPPPWCSLLGYFELIEQHAGTFTVAFRVRDYRMMPWNNLNEDPVTWSNFRFTWDPAKLELVEDGLGMDPEAAGGWICTDYHEPWYQDESLNIFVLGMRGGRALTDPILPDTYLPEYGLSYKTYEMMRFTFRQLASSGTTVIFPRSLQFQHYRGVKILDPLYIRLFASPPATERSGLIP